MAIHLVYKNWPYKEKERQPYADTENQFIGGGRPIMRILDGKCFVITCVMSAKHDLFDLTVMEGNTIVQEEKWTLDQVQGMYWTNRHQMMAIH